MILMLLLILLLLLLLSVMNSTISRNEVKLDLDSPGMCFFRNLNQGGLKLPVSGLELAARMHTVWARRVL